jgi:hypothetical protein
MELFNKCSQFPAPNLAYRQSSASGWILCRIRHQLAEVPLSLNLGAVNGHMVRIRGRSERRIFPSAVSITGSLKRH